MINVPYDFKGFIYSKEGYWTYEPFLFFTEKMTDSCDREDKDTRKQLEPLENKNGIHDSSEAFLKYDDETAVVLYFEINGDTFWNMRVICYEKSTMEIISNRQYMTEKENKNDKPCMRAISCMKQVADDMNKYYGITKYGRQMRLF